MKMQQLSNFRFARVAIFLLASPSISHAQDVTIPRYTAKDLGTLPGGQYSRAYGINAYGQVSGDSYIADGNIQSPFLSDPNGGPLHALVELFVGIGVNNNGQVTGYGPPAANDALLFDTKSGTLKNLGTLPGGLVAFAYGINDSGQVAGASDTTNRNIDSNGHMHAFLSEPNGGPLHDLGTLPGSSASSGFGVNALGQVAGHSYFSSFFHAFLSELNGGPLHDLGTLPGGSNSTAVGVNALGQVAGNSDSTNGTHAFLSAPNGGALTDLGSLAGTSSEVEEICGGNVVNNHGDVVGSSAVSVNLSHAFLYTMGKMYDLNELVVNAPGVIFFVARGINDFGQIIADGSVGGAFHAFLLSPVGDNVAPTTLATPSPNPNANGWNNVNVTVTLSATDNPGGSGVKQIQFALSGAQNAGLQTTFGNAASVTISAEGTTTLSYFATDNAGNQETAKMLTVRIDKTPPTISGLPAPGCAIWPPNHKLVQVATVTAADALSGLAPGSLKVTGTSNDPADGQIVITGGPSQFLVQLGADKDEIYTLTATASDLAGNLATSTATCNVPHDQGH